jgi:hypothetical protein
LQLVDAVNVGVPHFVPDAAWTAEQSWAQHWANAASANYVATGDIPLHSRVVQVGASDNLQAAIDAAPDNMTFELAAGGIYDAIWLVARSGIHLVAADPLNKPIVHGIGILGHTQLTDPLNQYPHPLVGGYTNFVNLLTVTKDASVIATYLDPPRDFLFRNIRIEPKAGALSEQNEHQTMLTTPVAGMLSGVWPGNNVPTAMACVADVCYEGCEFRNWVYTNTTGTNTGLPMPSNHWGIICGSAGLRNIVTRDCTFELGLYSNSQGAWQYVTYLDGPMGCAFVDNTCGTGWKGGLVLYLTNDDVSPRKDTDFDGVAGFNAVSEISSARWNAVVGNTVAGALIGLVRGNNNLFAGNDVTYNTTLTLSTDQMLEFDGECWKGGQPPSSPILDYLLIGNVFRDHVFHGLTVSGSAAIIRHGTPQGACGNETGGSTISGNTVSGHPVSKWYLDNTDGTYHPDASAATNNTDSNGTRNGA